MKRLAHHPIAAIFPMMTDAELDDLGADIVAKGLLKKIVMHEGKILDGRNRDEACFRAKRELIPLDFEDFVDVRSSAHLSPVEWVLSLNLKRRHLNESQRAMIGAKALPMLEAEADVRKKTGKKAVAQTLPPRGGKVPAETRAPTSAARAASAVGSSARSVERAKVVLDKAPKAELEKIQSGKKTLKQVEREIRKTEQVQKVRAYKQPEGEFSVIVTDPPWKFDDQLDGSDQVRGGCPYPPMETDAICAIKMPLAADCIVFLFVTNTHLINGDATRVLKAWGVKGMTMATWPKTSIKTGWWLRGQTEHVIMAARGKPVRTLTNQSTLLPAWPSGAHSDKPEEFYPWVESLCPAPDRLEMFSRVERRAGWTVCGAEAGSASPQAGKKRRDSMRFVDAAGAS